MSVSGQVVTVSALTLTSGSTVTVTYGSGGTSDEVAPPQVVETSTFTTQEKSTSSGTLTSIGTSPSVAVAVSANGSGTETVSPAIATESVGTSLTFTYTAALGGLYAGAITVTAPSGWTAPTTTSRHAGYSTASTGSVAVSGQVITVSGVTLAGGSTMTVSYGSGGGTNDAVPPSSSGTSTFTTQEKSTSSGTLTPIGTSSTVSVNPPDGTGTLSVSPPSAIENVSSTLTFTYTAAASGVSNGAVQITVPTGWTPPSSTSGTAGYTTSSAGTIAVSGQVITVSGLTLTSAQTATITYGSGGGTTGATPPSTIGSATFSAEEKSSSSGTLTALSSSPSVSVTTPPNGTGTMSVSPTTVLASSPATLAFTYTAGTDGIDGGSVAVAAPSGWTAPSTTPGNAGYVTASAGTVSVSGQVITVSGVTLTNGSTLTVTYGSGGGAASVVPPTTLGSATFTTEEASSSTGTLTSLASSPSVTDNASANGSGTETVSPTSVIAGAASSLTFTYTAATGGLVNGSVTLAAPSGWTAPSTSSGHAGYTTASTGTVSVSGQVITVSGVTLAGGSTLTISYGSGGGASSATAPSATESSTFATSEKSTSGGIFTSLSSSPAVTVEESDGLGSLAVSPASVIEAPVPTTLTFTYTAPSAGIDDGAVSVTVPSGWTAPSTSSGSAGYTNSSTGTVSVSGQVINVSGVTLFGSGTLTINYGAGGGSNAVTPSSTVGSATFSADEQSTSLGTLTPIASSPSVSVGMLGDSTLTLNEGTVTTLAGSGAATNTDGTGTAAAFNSPNSFAYVGSTLYVLDQDAIRKVNPTTGAVTTFIGPNSSGSSAYADSSNPADVTFEDPVSLTTDGSYLYFIDSGNLRRTDLSTGATETVLYGEYRDVVEGPDGNLYLDVYTYRYADVDQYDPTTGAINAIDSVATDYWPGTMVANSNDLFFESYDGAGQVQLNEISFSTFDETTLATLGGSNVANGLAVAGSYLYAVIDNGSSLARIDDGRGAMTTIETSTPGEGLGTDGAGDLFIADTSNNTIGEMTGSFVSAPPIGGVVTPAQSYGGSNPAEPGIGSGTPVNTENGDLTETSTDASVATDGPALDFERTYDAKLAQYEEVHSTPGSLGYGWVDNWSTSLSVSEGSGDVTVTQDDGSQVEFVPEVDGACTSPYVIPPPGGGYCTLPRVVASLSTSGSDYLFTLGGGTTYKYSGTGQFLSETDANGLRVTATYDTSSSTSCSGGATSYETLTASSGLTLVVGWSGSSDSGVITSVVDPMGRTWCYGYDSHDNLTSVTDPMGHVTSYGYDESSGTAEFQSDLTLIASPNEQSGGPDAGSSTDIAFDSSGRVSSMSDSNGNVTSYDYAAMDESTGTGSVETTDGDSWNTLYTYDQSELASETTGYVSSLASTTQYQDDPDTLLPITTVDPNGNATSSTYDASGNTLSTDDTLGRTTSATYNSLDEPVTSTSSTGSTTTSTYNSDGDLTGSSTPIPGTSSDATTASVYGDSSHRDLPTETTDADGNHT